MTVSKAKNIQTYIISFLIVIFVTVLWVEQSFAGNAPDFVLDSKSAILIEGKTERVIYQKGADVQRTPASLTKMMTCILTLENLDLEEKITIPKEAAGIQGNNIGLKPGEVLTVRELVNAMMIYSANDAAVALAIRISGSVDNFCRLMNKKARSLGCTRTNYINPNGLTDSQSHITTARDQSIIARYLMKKSEAAKIVRKSKYTVPQTNKSGPRKLKSTNEMLSGRKHEYKGIVGVKTGFMLSSGYCFAGKAQKNNEEFIAVVLNAGDEDKRFVDCGKLLDYGFNNYETVEFLKKGGSAGKVKVRYGSKTRVDTVVPDGSYLPVAKRETGYEKNIDVKMYDDVKAPIKKGTKVGEIVVYKDGRKISSSDIQIAETVKSGGPWSKYYISNRMFFIFVVGTVIITFMIIRMKRRRKNRFSGGGRR